MLHILLNGNKFIMYVFIVIAVEIVARIICIEINETQYTIFKNKRVDSDDISQLKVNSIIECSIQCTSAPGCIQANFVNDNKCELLPENQGNETDIVDDINSTLIRTY